MFDVSSIRDTCLSPRGFLCLAFTLSFTLLYTDTDAMLMRHVCTLGWLVYYRAGKSVRSLCCYSPG